VCIDSKTAERIVDRFMQIAEEEIDKAGVIERHYLINNYATLQVWKLYDISNLRAIIRWLSLRKAIERLPELGFDFKKIALSNWYRLEKETTG